MSLFAGKSVVKGLAFILGALALGAATPKQAEADVIRMPLFLGTTVPLGCANTGGHQDVAKTPVLKNTTPATLGKGFLVMWKASDSDYGSLRLETDLPPGGTVQALGKPGNGYSCTASFMSSPDLTVKTAHFATATSASFTLQNLDPWVDAAPSVTRVEVVACSGAVLATANVSTPQVPKGQSASFTVPFNAPGGGKRYLRIQADATKVLLERNEKNNMLDDINSCVW